MEAQITLHRFVHTHFSSLIQNRAKIERMGHKDIKTTINIYTHVTPEKIQETGERFAQYVNF